MNDLEKLITAFKESKRSNAKSFSLRIIDRTGLEEMKSIREIRIWWKKYYG